MEIINLPLDMQNIALSLLKQNKTIGFTPTMGALHDGHLSLIRRSLADTDKTIVSIFVNPTQFAPSEDLNKYPRPIEDDINNLKKLNVDYLFLPDAKDIYPSNYSTYVTVENITNKLCGLSRPNHFRGVTTICTKLFHITLPTISYFGQKDYQQSLIVKRLVKDLNIPTTIKILPIARDSDGLALSSRNVYLSEKERIESTNLYKSLQNAETIIQKGEKNCQFIKETIKNHLTKTPMIKIDYISICNPDTLEEVDQLDKGEVLIAIAAYLGKTRLIDNSLIQVSN